MLLQSKKTIISDFILFFCINISKQKRIKLNIINLTVYKSIHCNLNTILEMLS